MPNIAQWILKNKQNGLEPGETIQVALGVAIKNKVKDTAIGYAIAGGVGTLLAAEKLKEEQNQELSQSVPSIEQYPRGSVIIALTQTRLLVYALNWLGRPKTLAAAYPRTALAKVDMANGRLTNSVTLTFQDGGTVSHDVDRRQTQQLNTFVSLVNGTSAQVASLQNNSS